MKKKMELKRRERALHEIARDKSFRKGMGSDEEEEEE